jgi:hypothetical protein
MGVEREKGTGMAEFYAGTIMGDKGFGRGRRTGVKISAP